MTNPDYKRALIQHRLERANITLRDAYNLYNTEGSPVGIVNRSYYAMFYAALALLPQWTKKPQNISAYFRYLMKYL